MQADISTVYRWVRRFLPLFGKAVGGHQRPVGREWMVDETCRRLNGQWAYLYRVIGQDG